MPKGNYARENAMLLDPMRQKIAKNMTVLPGGPENNTPYTVEQSSGQPIQATSIYGDYNQNYAQMGTAAINPVQVGHSKLPGTFPTTKVGYNQQPYGMQPQPDASGISPAWDGMEGSRLASYGQKEGLPVAQMGIIGGPPISGYMPGDMPGTSGPPLMPGYAAITPGQSPQKINKKGKRTA